MKVSDEILNLIDNGIEPLDMIGQKMVELSRLEPNCSYRWFIKDLAIGTFHAFNENIRSPASSTRKLFILITVLLMVEQGKIRLSDTLIVDSKKAKEQKCGAIWFLDSSREFSIAELVKLMIGLSDNIATLYLVDLITLEKVNSLSKLLKLSGTTHVSAVPNQMLSVDHPLNVVNTTTALDLTTALDFLINGAIGLLPKGDLYISAELCKFGLDTLRGQQYTTAVRNWLTEEEHIGDKHGIGYRNYNNVCYLAQGDSIRLIFSIIIDDLHLVNGPIPSLIHAKDFVALFSKLLDNYTKKTANLN